MATWIEAAVAVIYSVAQFLDSTSGLWKGAAVDAFAALILTVAGLTQDRIQSFILDPLADRPGSALDTLKKVRILIKHAIGKGGLSMIRRLASEGKGEGDQGVDRY